MHVEGTTPIDYNVFFNKVGLTLGDKKVETSFIQDGNGFIFGGDQEKMTLFFSESVANNSFWTEEGILPNDVIKEVGGTLLTLQNAQTLIGNMYQWQPEDDYEIKIERDGEAMIFKGKLKQAYTVSKSLMEDENATTPQKELRKAWLKG
jgi:predicted metalloprotease with PDZ domain